MVVGVAESICDPPGFSSPLKSMSWRIGKFSGRVTILALAQVEEAGSGGRGGGFGFGGYAVFHFTPPKAGIIMAVRT